MIHLYVEVLDRYFGNVCELDIIFNFHKVASRTLVLCPADNRACHRHITFSTSCSSPGSLRRAPKRRCAALEAAVPEQGGTVEYQRWRERCSDAREKCQAAQAAAANAAAYAKLEPAIVDAEQAVIQACRARRIKVTRPILGD